MHDETGIADVERSARRTERLGFALLLVITLAVTIALGFTVFTAIKASQASARNRRIITQVAEESRRTRLALEDVIRQDATLLTLLNELAAKQRLPQATLPPRLSQPETPRPATPRATPRRTSRPTSRPATPRPTQPPTKQPTPPPTPCAPDPAIPCIPPVPGG